ncbi:MAG: hypothetical protein KR126chlam3_00944 [Chlamydiae bacterium]|nr:hypothetical protein [Chlamydiota bacterium]
MSEDLLISIFCSVDDFYATFELEWEKILLDYRATQKLKKSSRTPALTMSELMTIVLCFHHSKFRTFKDYFNCAKRALQSYFPNLVSYGRMVELMQRCLFPLFCFLQTLLE